MPCLWVLFTGGTGTGKSTLFNAFSGKPLSETGVERPRTFGPIVYAHRDCPIEQDFPFPSIQIARQTAEDHHSSPSAGTPGRMLVLEHEREDWAHLVIVDTPDLDSVEAENRRIAEDLYRLCDAVVFVTTQEKYADEVPYNFLLKIVEEGKPFFFLLNKAQEPLTEKEVLETFEGQGLMLKKDRLWLIPYAPSHTAQRISEHSVFRSFLLFFSQELTKDGVNGLRQTQLLIEAQSLSREVGRLVHLLEEEQQAAQRWVSQLGTFYEETCRNLIREEKERFTAQSREYVQREIRRLFARYDILAKPRRFIREVLLTPLQLLGILRKSTPHAHKDDLLKVRGKIDVTPVQRAIEKFNRLVLEKLSPSDHTSRLFRQLRQTGVAIDDQAVKDRVWKEQDKLDAWLEDTFRKLSRGMPKHKRWGIYSTSIIWGILILCLEMVVGGGFSVLDAALDSAIAPFLTKGAVELFAYHEIQKISRRLAQRYQQGLLSVVREQYDRYADCIQSLMTPRKAQETLEVLHTEISSWSFEPKNMKASFDALIENAK
jgi:energy-coupling factor transporter ATP-binding protein EcfA2